MPTDEEIANEIIKKKTERVCPYCVYIPSSDIRNSRFKCGRFGREFANEQDANLFGDEPINKLYRHYVRPNCPVLAYVLKILKEANNG